MLTPLLIPLPILLSIGALPITAPGHRRTWAPYPTGGLGLLLILIGILRLLGTI